MTGFGPKSLMVAVSAILASGLMVVASAAPQAPAQPPQTAKAPAAGDEAGVNAMLKAVTEAYNKADAKALSALFADDAAMINSDGEETRGREAITKQYEAAFSAGPTAQMVGEVDAIRFPLPDVATVAGVFELRDSQGAAVSFGRFGVLGVRNNGAWKISELRDYSVQEPEPENHYAKLQELEWMVGEWLDEGQDSKISTEIRWAEGQNFLVRTYKMEVEGAPVTSGTQWIGWDPQSRQIKSWVFDSEGGHGVGSWTRSGDAWVIKAQGVLRDGGSTSATQVIEPVNKDSVKIRSIDRIVDGELVADGGEVLMVRQPPKPVDSAPAPAAAPAATAPK